MTVVLIVLLGSATVAFSRYQAHHPASAIAPTTSDTWHAALGFDVCGKFLPNLKQNPNVDQVGLATHGDGIITIKPRNKSESGHNATLGRFVKDYPGLELTSARLHYPGRRTWSNGEKCGSHPATIRVEQWSSLAAATGQAVPDPTSLRLENGQLITVAFLPAGARIPKPHSQNNLLSPAPVQTTTTTSPTTTTTSPTTTTTKAKSTKAKGAKSTTTTTAKGAKSTTTTTKP